MAMVVTFADTGTGARISKAISLAQLGNETDTYMIIVIMRK